VTVTTDIALPAGMVDAINTALLAGRGRDTRTDIVDSIAGTAAPLDESVAIAGVAVDYLAGRIRDDELEAAVAFAASDARRHDWSAGERAVTQQLATAVVRAWVDHIAELY
jgi:hypothetical protein